MNALHPEERVDLFARVLAAPFDLDAARTHTLKFDGRPDRRETVLPALMTRWAQRRLVDAGEGCGVEAVRVSPLRIVRRKVAR